MNRVRMAIAAGAMAASMLTGGVMGAARLAVQQVLDEVDRAYSRFRADSELSALNANPGSEQALGPLLALALAAAVRGAQLSGGAVDLTVGRALRLAGYDTTFASVAPAGPGLVLKAHSIPGWQAVRFDARRHTVRLPACVDANIASTAAIVKGAAAPAWLESAELPARLVDREGRVTRLRGWPEAVSSR